MELVVFTTDNCRHCGNVISFLNNVGVPFTEVNTTDEPEAVEKHDLMGAPTTILFDGNEEITRTMGFQAEELNVMIDNLD